MATKDCRSCNNPPQVILTLASWIQALDRPITFLAPCLKVFARHRLKNLLRCVSHWSRSNKFIPHTLSFHFLWTKMMLVRSESRFWGGKALCLRQDSNPPPSDLRYLDPLNTLPCCCFTLLLDSPVWSALVVCALGDSGLAAVFPRVCPSTESKLARLHLRLATCLLTSLPSVNWLGICTNSLWIHEMDLSRDFNSNNLLLLHLLALHKLTWNCIHSAALSKEQEGAGCF